jgi:hypothetical protein
VREGAQNVGMSREAGESQGEPRACDYDADPARFG